MPLRNVATTFTIEQQRLEINALAGDVNNIATGVTNVGTAATANALAAGATGADLTLSGTLTVNGTQTILNTATLEVEDKNIVIAKGSTTDAAASGGGITLKGADDKTISYNQTGDQWEFNKTLSSNSDGTTARDLKLVSGSTWGIRSNPTTGTNSYGFEIYKGGAGTDIKLKIDSDGNAWFNNNVNIPGHLEISASTCLIDLMETGSTNHRIRNGNGNFHIQALSADKSATTNQLVIDGGTGETALYHTGNKKLATTSTGVTVTGSIISNGITQYALPTMGGGGQLGWDDGTKSFRLYANSSTGSNAKVQFHFNQSGTAGITFDQDSSATFGGNVSDSKGNVRSVPTSPLSGTHAGGYVMLASDVGKCVAMSGDVTLQSAGQGGPFGGGDVITILNASASAITLNEGSGLTLYDCGTGNTGNRALGPRGMATVIYMYGGNTAYISGAQLT